MLHELSNKFGDQFIDILRHGMFEVPDDVYEGFDDDLVIVNDEGKVTLLSLINTTLECLPFPDKIIYAKLSNGSSWFCAESAYQRIMETKNGDTN